MGGMRAVVLLALAVLSAPVPAAAAGDPVEGARLARQWCVSCHGGSDAAPGLETVANRPGRTPYTLRAWLTEPHPPMPNFSLPREEIDHLVAYLASLARGR
jgi:mono/diheme cytochrome c family protein